MKQEGLLLNATGVSLLNGIRREEVLNVGASDIIIPDVKEAVRMRGNLF